MFFDSRELPASWNRETLLGKDDTDDEDDEMVGSLWTLSVIVEQHCLQH